MNWDTFWQIVGAAYRRDAAEHFEALKAELEPLKWFEVVAFQARFNEAVDAANTPALGGAATLVNGTALPEAFRDFRVWLVARGRDAYEAALANPDSLADVLDGDPVDGFGLEKASLRVYEARTGTSDFYIRLGREPKTIGSSTEIAHFNVADETELRTRYPRLSELYPTPPDTNEETP